MKNTKTLSPTYCSSSIKKYRGRERGKIISKPVGFWTLLGKSKPEIHWWWHISVTNCSHKRHHRTSFDGAFVSFLCKLLPFQQHKCILQAELLQQFHVSSTVPPAALSQTGWLIQLQWGLHSFDLFCNPNTLHPSKHTFFWAVCSC